jgi:hypothetical protein
VCWEPDSPILLAAIDRLKVAGEQAGKKMMMVGDPATWIPRGYPFICIGEPSGMLEGVLTQRVNEIRTQNKTLAQPKATPV